MDRGGFLVIAGKKGSGKFRNAICPTSNSIVPICHDPIIPLSVKKDEF
jgi:hypothetical protein